MNRIPVKETELVPRELLQARQRLLQFIAANEARRQAARRATRFTSVRTER